MIGERGNAGLGSFIDNVARMMKLVEELAEKGEIVRQGEISGLSGNARGVYGLRVRTVVGGQPEVESFGNIRESPAGPVVVDRIEPIVDVFDEGPRILVVAEVPGAAPESVAVDVSGDVLTISACGGGRVYGREVLLPARVRKETLDVSYRNGIIEVEAEREV